MTGQVEGRRTGTPRTPRVLARGAGSRSIRPCRCGCSARPEVSAADAVIDVGGGASPLTRALLDRGLGTWPCSVSPLPGSGAPRDQLGERAGQVRWLAADISQLAFAALLPGLA